jgi:small subunit ribosomal protein S17
VYGKYMTRSTKVHAHDADNTVPVIALVSAEAAPISKSKSSSTG